MTNDISAARNKKELQTSLALLQAAANGQLDGLVCPQCHAETVSVWFTRRSKNDYWTWVLCDQCDFELRAQGDRPQHYSTERERSLRQTGKKPSSVTT